MEKGFAAEVLTMFVPFPARREKAEGIRALTMTSLWGEKML